MQRSFRLPLRVRRRYRPPYALARFSADALGLVGAGCFVLAMVFLFRP